MSDAAPFEPPAPADWDAVGAVPEDEPDCEAERVMEPVDMAPDEADDAIDETERVAVSCGPSGCQQERTAARESSGKTHDGLSRGDRAWEITSRT